MNEIRRIDSEAHEIARVRAVMDTFDMPEFVTGYTVSLGEFDEGPAVWVRFETNHRFPDTKEEMLEVGRALSELSARAHIHLREFLPDRYPYFRFGDSGTATEQA